MVAAAEMLNASFANFNDCTTPTQDPSTANRTVIFYPTLFMLGMIAVIGTAGNALVLYVYGIKKERTSTRIFILTLAAIDFLTCAVIVPYTIAVEWVNFILFSDFLCKSYHFLVASSVPLSAFVMAAISVDRYICICQPMRFKLSVLTVKLVIMFLAALALGLGIIVALLYGNVDDVDVNVVKTETNCSVTLEKPVPTESVMLHYGQCYTNHDVLSKGFLDVFKTVHLIMYLISLTVITLMYALLYVNVRRYNRRKSALLGSSMARAIYLMQSKADSTVVEATSQHNIYEGNPLIASDPNTSPKVKNAKSIQFKLDELGNDNKPSNAETEEKTSCSDDVKNKNNNTQSNSDPVEDSPPAQNTLSVTTNGRVRKVSIAESPVDTGCSNNLLNAENAGTNGRAPVKPKGIILNNLDCDNLSNTCSVTSSTCSNAEMSCTERLVYKLFNNGARTDNAGRGCFTGFCQRPPGSPESPRSDISQRHFSLTTVQEETDVTDMTARSYNGGVISETTRRGKTCRRHNNNNNMHPRKQLERKMTREIFFRSNLKTASMLFVVTVVFIVTYLPGALMINGLLEFNLFGFYIYFINNMANPIIYSFMNKNFRNDLAQICKRRSR